MIANHEPTRFFEKRIHLEHFNKPVGEDLYPDQRAKIRRLLAWHKPPNLNQLNGKIDQVDIILVAGTSPFFDLSAYCKRIQAALEFSQHYPNARVIFSGRRPEEGRATAAERQKGYSEGRVMAQNAFALGLRREITRTEGRAKSTEQNIIFTLNKLRNNPLEGILVICSSFMARRVNYYLQKELNLRGLATMPHFIYDADVAEYLDNISPNPCTNPERIENSILYEAKRLSRAKGLARRSAII